MGLDTTHDAWHGSYGAFHRWRSMIARIAGLPPLELMEGFFAPQGVGHGVPTFYLGIHNDELVVSSIKRIEESLPIRWDSLKPSALHELLYHSDCDGSIPHTRCKAIADALDKLLPLLPNDDAGGHIGNWKDKTSQFIAGLRKAAKARQNLAFH